MPSPPPTGKSASPPVVPAPQRPRTPLAAWYEADGTEISVEVDMTLLDQEEVILMDPPSHVSQMPRLEDFDGPAENFVGLSVGTPVCQCGYPMGRFMEAPRKRL